MISLGLFVRLEAKPGKEKEVAAFLKQGLQMANQEPTTELWFALRLGPSTFGIFDAFADESGRQAHLNGPIAKALMANAPDLLAAPQSIEKTEILGAKLQEARRQRECRAALIAGGSPFVISRSGYLAIVT
jgi:quinol monooxygenase YgiN